MFISVEQEIFTKMLKKISNLSLDVCISKLLKRKKVQFVSGLVLVRDKPVNHIIRVTYSLFESR